MITGAALATINTSAGIAATVRLLRDASPRAGVAQLEHPVSADLSVNDCFRPVSRFFNRFRVRTVADSTPRSHARAD